MDKQIVVYKTADDIRLEVQTDGETVWLTQEQMCRLFGRTQSVIARHIANIFKEGELDRDSVYAKNAYTASDGKIYQVAFYNLDVVISVGYRVKSIQGTRFRQWATRVLREMLLNRLDEIKRITKLERRMDSAEGDIKQIKGGVSYLVQQLSVPQEAPRRRIGFGSDDDKPSKPCGRAYRVSATHKGVADAAAVAKATFSTVGVKSFSRVERVERVD